MVASATTACHTHFQQFSITCTLTRMVTRQASGVLRLPQAKLAHSMAQLGYQKHSKQSLCFVFAMQLSAFA
jgi:hypothetical protein